MTQRLPQRPQWATSVASVVSQPSPAVALQSAKPALHGPIAQTPAEHVAAALAKEHARPQAPQLDTVVVEVGLAAVGHHAVAVAEARAARAERAHAPDAQVALAFAKEHALPQRPQCDALAANSTSQPLVATPSQLPKPAPHAPIAHTPEAQLAAALAYAQRLPHAPHDATSVLVLVSQPFPAMPSQSASGAVHVAPTMHAPPAQKAVRPAGAVQTLPQRPQSRDSVCVLVSQPSLGSPLQSA